MIHNYRILKAAVPVGPLSFLLPTKTFFFQTITLSLSLCQSPPSNQHTMSRWHSSSCKRPDVSVASGIPCYNYYFTITIIEQKTRLTDSPLPLRNSSQSSLWPSYLNSKSPNISKKSTEYSNSKLRTDSQKSSLPTLPSKDHI